MAHVPPAPRSGRSYDGDRREVLAELARIDREKPPRNPGSVQSTDGSVIRIPGPLDDTGRQGHVLTYDEDLHQPIWTPAATGGGGLSGAIATAANVTSSDGSALDHGSMTWSLFSGPDYGAAPSWLTLSEFGRLELDAGSYLASLQLDIGWAAGSAPSRVRFRMANTIGDGNAWNYASETYPTTASYDGARLGLQRVVNLGHMLVPSPSALEFTLEFYDAGSAGSLGRIDSSSAAVVQWYIARVG